MTIMRTHRKLNGTLQSILMARQKYVAIIFHKNKKQFSVVYLFMQFVDSVDKSS